MYSRSYQNETDRRPLPPPNYDGTAFSEDKNSGNLDTGAGISEIPEKYDAPEPEAEKASARVGGFFPQGILSLFSGGGIKLPKIGAEEILIIATALFLFFSGDGDPECAILLLLLLLVN